MNLIFDWSGTLCDDEQLTFELTRETVVQFGGAPLDWEAYRSEFTIPVDGFYAKRCPGVAIADIDCWFCGRYGARLAELRLFGGTAELLTAWAREHRLFVLSTLATELIEGALERLDCGFAITHQEGHVRSVVRDAREARRDPLGSVELLQSTLVVTAQCGLARAFDQRCGQLEARFGRLGRHRPAA